MGTILGTYKMYAITPTLLKKKDVKGIQFFSTCTMLNIASDINPFNYPLNYPPSDANQKS